MSFKRFYLKGMAICTLICTLFAVPSFARNAEILKTANIRYLGGNVAASNSFGVPSNIMNMLQSIDCSKHNVQNGYYSSIQEKMDCFPDPFCEGKWHCHTNCIKEGYVDGVADSKNELAKKEPDYSCESCPMKGETYWRCVPNKCEGDLKAEDECKQWEKFVPNEKTHRYGELRCGTCVENTKPCGEDNDLKTSADVLAMMDINKATCYSCSVHHTVPGQNGDIKCYDCNPLKGYTRGPWMDSNTCYTYYNTGGGGADSISNTNCYKRLLHVCEVDKYLTGKKAEGGNVSIEIEMTNGSGEALDISSHDDTFLVDQANKFGTLVGCECRNYIYDLKVEPEHADITAAGGTVTFTVMSTRTGPSANAWDYDFIPQNNLCSVVKNGTQFQVTCPRRAANSPATFGVTFKQVTKGKETKLYPYENLVTILADKCPEGQSMDNSCSGGLISQSGDYSDAGQQCFKCVEDVCPEGQFSCNAGEVMTSNGKTSPSGRACYNCAADVCPEGQFDCGADEVATANGKTSPSGRACFSCKSDKCPEGYTRGTPPSSEGYDISSTETGNPCYKKLDAELPDSCPSGYDTSEKNCDPGYVEEKQGQTNGKDCTKCTPVSCPSISGCKDYRYCPVTKANCEGKVTCDDTVIAGVTKYYNCKCDVKPCGDANKRYDETTCSCIDEDCAEGYSKDVANCKDGEELSTDPNNSSCKRCQAKSCEAGLLPNKVTPAGGDATGNPYVTCVEVKCEGTTKYKNCSCNISDQICGTGKKADTNNCSCKDCGGIAAGDPKYDRYICTQSFECGGQKRYIAMSCEILGNQWVAGADQDCKCPNNRKVDINGLSYCDTKDTSCLPTGCPEGYWEKSTAGRKCKEGNGHVCTMEMINGVECYSHVDFVCGAEYTLSNRPLSATSTYTPCKTGEVYKYKCNDGYGFNSGDNTCVVKAVVRGEMQNDCPSTNPSWFSEAEKSNQKCGSGYDCTYVGKAENEDSCYTRTVHNCGSAYNLDLQPSSGSDTYDTCLTGEGAMYKCKTNYVFSEDLGNQCVPANTCPSTYPEEAAASCTRLHRDYDSINIGSKMCYNCTRCSDGYEDNNGALLCKKKSSCDGITTFTSKTLCEDATLSRGCQYCKQSNGCWRCERWNDIPLCPAGRESEGYYQTEVECETASAGAGCNIEITTGCWVSQLTRGTLGKVNRDN